MKDIKKVNCFDSEEMLHNCGEISATRKIGRLARSVQKLIQAKNLLLTAPVNWLEMPHKCGKLVGFRVGAGV